MNWDTLFTRFFPKVLLKNGLFATIVLIIKTEFVIFEEYISNKLNRDI